MGYQKIQVPATGDKITVNADMSLSVPKNPIIPFIEGDGIGVDISPVMIKVVDAAVEKAYKGERKIAWMKSTPARRPPRSMTRTPGCPRKPWTPCATTWFPSRAR